MSGACGGTLLWGSDLSRIPSLGPESGAASLDEHAGILLWS
jgi:hypothetical protein